MKKLIIANWKMNPVGIQDARFLFSSLEHRMPVVSHYTEVAIAAPFVFLPPLSHYSHLVKLAAQNVSWADSGAFTGEISALQLKNLEVHYVILGHSERRLYLGETDSMVNAKAIALLNHKIIPVICLGGEESAKKPEDMPKLITKQFSAAIKGLEKNHIQKIIFVYEPVWAISTMKNSKPATGEHARDMILHIQTLLGKKVGKEHGKNMRILYGGTVNKHNVHDFAKYPEIDGALVGAASLDINNFFEIINEFNREGIHRV